MRISDWSSDVCSSDLQRQRQQRRGQALVALGDVFVEVARIGDVLGRVQQVVDEQLVLIAERALHLLAHGAEIDGVADRKSVVTGKSVLVRVDLGGRRIIKKKNKKQIK